MAHVLKAWNPRECYGKTFKRQGLLKGPYVIGNVPLQRRALVYFSSSLSWIPGS